MIHDWKTAFFSDCHHLVLPRHLLKGYWIFQAKDTPTNVWAKPGDGGLEFKRATYTQPPNSLIMSFHTVGD
jgi:hypothetical protein